MNFEGFKERKFQLILWWCVNKSAKWAKFYCESKGIKLERMDRFADDLI